MKTLKSQKLVTVLLMAALVIAIGGVTIAQQFKPFDSDGDEYNNTCPGVPFPLPDFSGLDCKDLQSKGPQAIGISPSIHFYSPTGPTTISVPYGTTEIPIYITNIPMPPCKWITILLAHAADHYIDIRDLSCPYPPSGQLATYTDAGDPGVEYFIAWVDLNCNGVVDGPGELTIPWLTMYVYGDEVRSSEEGQSYVMRLPPAEMSWDGHICAGAPEFLHDLFRLEYWDPEEF